MAEQTKARTVAETHARTLSVTLEQEEEALRRTQEEAAQAGNQGASLGSQLEQTRALMEAAEASNKQLTKSRDLLVAQLKNSKEVLCTDNNGQSRVILCVYVLCVCVCVYHIDIHMTHAHIGGGTDNSGQSDVSQQDQALRDEARAGCKGARGPAHICVYI